MISFFLTANAVCLGSTPLPQPPNVTSVNGVLHTTLHVVPSTIDSGPFTFQRRSYNGLPVGPTLRVKRGDKVVIVLKNELGDEPETAIGQHYTNAMAKNKTGDWLHDKDVYAYPNHTNLHIHGLHVSPLGDHDNIFRHIPPLSNATYEYDIPHNHPTGTFWYHPHYGGSSALQLASGMMGAFIVQDDPATDPLETLKDMEEVVLVVHEVSHSHNPLLKQNIICYFCLDNFMWPAGDRLPLNKKLDTKNFPEYKHCGGKAFPGTKNDFMQRTQPLDCTYVLLNGVYQPDIEATRGVMQRWRFVQSGHQSTIRMAIDPECEVLLFARDGIYFPSPVNATGVPLVVAAGSRVDMGVRCARVGEFSVNALTGGYHNSSDDVTLYEPVLYPRLMARIIVDGDGDDEGNVQPKDEPIVLPKNPMDDLMNKPVDRHYTVTYNLTAWGTHDSKVPPFFGQFINGGQFSLNKKSFTNRTEHCMVMGQVEEWTIVNAANKLERWEHSFHIHQNSFQVVSQDRGMPGQVVLENISAGEWRDTVQIPVRGSVTFRMQPKDFIGKFPYHCHVTAHQDIGMMQLAEVVVSEKECPAKNTTTPHAPPRANWKCPSWFGQPICDIECVAAHCSKEISACIEDRNCRERLSVMTNCMKNKTIYPSDCLVPDNMLLDNFIHCSMEEHPCLKTPSKPAVYPPCRDHTIPGDPSFVLSKLYNPPRTWYKVHGWVLGEPIECMPCQTATFTPIDPNATKTPTSGVTFRSTWLNPDGDNVLWHMNATATIKYRLNNTDHSKLNNTGVMFGLTFREPYTVVAAALDEDEPYLFFYVCGGTLQGNYTTSFVLSTKPTLKHNTSLRAHVERIGLKWKDFCTVDNKCFDGL